MSDDRNALVRQQLLDEIWEEISSLQGKELDEYLASICLSPKDLEQSYSKALEKASVAARRARFEEAQRYVSHKKIADFSNVISLDVARKKQIVAAVRDYADRTKDMTIAARNRKIEDERDLDVFLEACLCLGIIDSNGNLKG